MEVIKFSPTSIELPAISIYLHVIYILLILALVKYVVGKIINKIFNWVLIQAKVCKNIRKMPDWIAECKNRSDIPQKQDIKPIDLRGQYLKGVKFTVSLIGDPEFWRVGFMIGNEKYFAHNIVDTNNAITIHTGSGYNKKDKLLPVWKYYGEFKHNNPDSSSVSTVDISNIDFILDINEDNFMVVRIENEVVFAQKINPSFRRRIFLKAWADDQPDFKVKFSNIKYTLWS